MSHQNNIALPKAWESQEWSVVPCLQNIYSDSCLNKALKVHKTQFPKHTKKKFDIRNPESLCIAVSLFMFQLMKVHEMSPRHSTRDQISSQSLPPILKALENIGIRIYEGNSLRRNRICQNMVPKIFWILQSLPLLDYVMRGVYVWKIYGPEIAFIFRIIQFILSCSTWISLRLKAQSLRQIVEELELLKKRVLLSTEKSPFYRSHWFRATTYAVSLVAPIFDEVLEDRESITYWVGGWWKTDITFVRT